MEIKVKLSRALESYKSDEDNEFEVLCFDTPVPVRQVLKKIELPDELPKLILINGMVRDKDHVLGDGDTLSIFPAMAGG